jgi:adenine-specific DNA-methyltransferase
MATGVTLNNWTKDTHIVTDEIFTGECKYELNYDGKTSEFQVINSKQKNEYELIVGGHGENDLYFGDNLDVMSHLLHQKNLKGKVKLVYIDPPYGTNSIFQSRHQKDSYRDDLIGSHFIEFIRRRLILIRELLSEDGLPAFG